MTVITYLIACNISYFIAIMPDHDMIETADNKNGFLTNDWGEMQVRNSGNFATRSQLMTEMYGGINYQIEHHLFPSISHVHYMNISHIVKQTCAEYKIPYVESDTIWTAIRSVLRNFGRLHI